MSNKKTSRALFSAVIKEFNGVDASAKYEDPLGSSQIVNFRIDKNGALRKRCGFGPLVSLPNGIDSLWSGRLFGQDRIVMVSGNTVYQYAGSTLREIGQIDGIEEGKSSIFLLDGELYFLTKAGIFRLDHTGLSTPVLYPPLIGKDWPSGWLGEPYEKRNLLSDYARITYLINDNPMLYLRIPEPIDGVAGLSRNGYELSREEFEIDNNNLAIRIHEANEGDVFELTVKLKKASDELSLDARTALECTVLGGIEQNRPCFWDSKKGNRIYPSRALSKDSISDSRKHVMAVPIYVTEDDVISVGTGDHKVMAITSHFGRTLIFTENDTWRAASVGDEALSDSAPMRINTSIGTLALGGVVSVGNDPVSIGKHSLFKWTSNTDELDEQNTYVISSGIDPLISDGFRKSGALYFDRDKGDLYFYSRGTDSVWVWNVGRQKWVRFEGFAPDLIFEHAGRTAFVSGKEICIFDDSLTRDSSAFSSADIEARFISNPIDFGSFEDKHLTFLEASAEGGELCVGLAFNDEETASKSFSVSPKDSKHIIRQRIASRRFKCVRLEIRASGASRQVLHSVRLDAR